MPKFSEKEPFLCNLLLITCIIEFPVLNLFLFSSFLLYLCLVIVYKRRSIINTRAIILMIFISMYFMIDSVLEQSVSYKFFYAISVISIYLSGMCIVFHNNQSNSNSNKIENVIRLISHTFFIYVVVSILYSLIKGQLALSRNPLDIWSGNVRAATHYGTMLIFPLGYGIYQSLIKYGKDRIIGYLMVVITAIINIVTASRTILFFIPVGYIIGYYYSIKITRKITRKHLNQLVGFLIILALVIVILYLNLFGIQNLIMNSALGHRYVQGYVPNISEDGRIAHWHFFFSNFHNSLLGGGYSRIHSGNLHNIFLNVFDLSGVIPFIFLLFFTFLIYKNLRNVLWYNKVNIQVRVLLLIIYTLAFLQLLIEPVMESVPVFCWCLLYLSGAITSLDSSVERN